MSSNQLKSPRCGRCAEPIPEDTSTYCKSCGVPFFKVSPTTDFHLIAEEHYKRGVKRQQLSIAIFSVLVFFILITGSLLVLREVQKSHIANLKSFPKLRFYFYDFPEFSSLSRSEKTQAVYVAIQSFEDHFDLKIDEYEILHNEIPSNLTFLSTGYFSDLSKFKFWDDRVFEKNLSSWLKKDREHLDILVSNFPIYLGDTTKIESRHLNQEKLISGLGHPSLVIATSFRMLKELLLKSSTEKSRHLGEYIIAHELGHGLLGIPDYIIKQNSLFFRGPASVQESYNDAPKLLAEHCLMHTDEGGGAIAWEHIRKRNVGSQVSCTAYTQIISANKLRSQAIEEAKAGKLGDARNTMTLAISQIKGSAELSNSWVRALWEQELELLGLGF